MRRWLKYILLASILLLLASIPLAMQFDTGSIQGVITNDREPVAKALVEARNVATSVVTRTESDREGNYRFESLHPGRYSLWVRATGYDSKWILDVMVVRGETTHQDIQLTRIPTTTTGWLGRP